MRKADDYKGFLSDPAEQAPEPDEVDKSRSAYLYELNCEGIFERKQDYETRIAERRMRQI